MAPNDLFNGLLALYSCSHANSVPSDVALLGVRIYTQAVILAGPRVITNALDIVVEY